MHILEVAVIARLLLELLALAPSIINEVDQAAQEMNTNDPTGTKAAKAAEAAAVIAQAAAKVVAAATDTKGK